MMEIVSLGMLQEDQMDWSRDGTPEPQYRTEVVSNIEVGIVQCPLPKLAHSRDSTPAYR
jgi:hypothetical protein